LVVFSLLEALGDPDNHRASVFENVHVFWFQDRYQHKAVSALQTARCIRYGVKQIFAFVKLDTDKNSDYLGVCLTTRLDSQRFNKALKFEVIADDAIVDERNPVFVIEVRVRVAISLVAVGGPPRVPDCY
jgi:hypothetical protein